MPLIIGTVSVDENGDATGSGLALAIFNGTMGSVDADARALVGEGMADFCEGIATAIVEHFQANGLIVVTVSDGGLQNTPNPNNPDTPTAAPAAPIELNGTIE